MRDAQDTYSKAVKSELAQNYDTAFRLYTEATELFLHLARSHPTQAEKWRTSAGRALERAEKLKQFASAQKAVHLTPPAANSFADSRQSLVLQKGATVNGLSYPLWSDPQNSLPSKQAGVQPQLSHAQIDAKAEWRLPPADHNPRVLPDEITQQLVTDCSVSASLTVLLRYSQQFPRFKETLLNLVHHDSEALCHVKLFLNGAWRRVLVDDNLPYDPQTGQLLCMMSGDRRWTWPSIVEKAYMKLLGGYNFPGSDSGTDIHALCGWVPEYIPINSRLLEGEKTWNLISEGMFSGKLVFTLGTGPKVPLDAELLPSHCYAVTDLQEDEDSGVRYLSMVDTSLGQSAAAGPSRHRQMEWSTALGVFEGLYLSWNVDRFKHCLKHNSLWKVNTNHVSDASVHQVFLTFKLEPTDDKPEILIHLNRHIYDSAAFSRYIALNVQFQDEITDSGLHLIGIPSSVESYTSSSHVVARAVVPTGMLEGRFSILSLCDGIEDAVGFTLSAYTNSGTIAWDEVGGRGALPCSRKLEGAFTSKTAGGNAQCPTFMTNPQYKLNVHPAQSRSKTQMVFTLKAARELPLNVTVARSDGRVFDLARKDIMVHSGAYSYGVARASGEIPPGAYTLVVSTFEAQQKGEFSLVVEGSHPFEIENIAQEGAGLYTHTTKGLWDELNAMGGPSFQQYTLNPIYEVSIATAAQIKIRLQLPNPSPTTYINVSIYRPFHTASALGEPLASSGTYVNTSSGAVTTQTQLAAGTYWIIPSTFTPGTLEAFKLLVYSSIRDVGIQLRDPL
ncbi:hypothetical protein BDV98DRAFT_557061 [Pterulicium gracile]|uniref:Calpain catalytic domain-containing protein n=1 Tax=Pterulicium gracile TaxID=1884261 RepID=A0A5C3QY94_9AGAR|nr:hypothetical protein BDV98DRAFT_557061 [Pterula gracilis]